MSLNYNAASLASQKLPLIPLDRMSAGQRAPIAEIVGRTEHVQRLQELGLRHGVEVEMVRAGSPCIVRLQGNTLCIRGNEVLNVLVGCGE
ncbi:MAG TPA: FeoA family protein [Pirellulales bacterium]|jgi:ferrous iron transport protein A